MEERRGPWYLLTGLVLGLSFGLLYAWVFDPVEYVDTTPASLRTDFKDRYRSLIAAAYMSNADLVRAQARLELLGDQNIFQTLAEQAQRTLGEGNSPDDSRALGLLAVAIGQGTGQVKTNQPPFSPSAPSLTSTPAATATLPPQPTVSPTPRPSATPGITASLTLTLNPGTQTAIAQSSTGSFQPIPTRTPTATPGAPFILQESTKVCDPNLGEPLIQVLALDASGNQVAGAEIIITYDGGEDHIFTGLKPEIGPGYADFKMSPGVIYTVRPVDAGEIVNDLVAQECTEGGNTYLGGWSLIFAQP